MNYGISVLFRTIPLLMALFCFGYGAFVLDMGTDPAKNVAGPVVMSLGMICIALFATAATINPADYSHIQYGCPVRSARAWLSGCPTDFHLRLGIYQRSCHRQSFRSRTCNLRRSFHHCLRGNDRHFFHPVHPYTCQFPNDGKRCAPTSL